MLTITDKPNAFNSFLTDVKQAVCDLVSRQFQTQLDADVDTWLRRGYHERRIRVGKQRTQAVCCRCGSDQAQQFSRNGHRRRQLVTGYGVFQFWLPRVVCQCGGSVAIPFTILEPYQRWWNDVLEQIGRWAELGLSLRQMQAEIGEQIGTQVGLRKLNQVVQQVEQPVPIAFSSVAPVIMLDAIWVTLLDDTASRKKDKLGRQRVTKARHKVCILVALGIYPQSQRWGILDWQLAGGEGQADWERLLLRLEGRGVYRERGVELFSHDGGKGLIAALELISPHIPHQRCVFHKLRNLWHSIQTPEGLSRQERMAFKQDLLQQVQPIFYAADGAEARRRRDDLCAQWQDTQPDFVATLQRDWEETLAFFRVLNRFPKWPRRALRTTSLLERVNRMLRRLFPAAGAFHSIAGLLAAVTRVLTPKRLI